MKVLIQWSRLNPIGWEEINSIDWPTLKAKDEPIGGEIIDDDPGWLFDLNIQGNRFYGADHYHVEEFQGFVRVTAWGDDPKDYPPNEFWAVVYDIYPLSTDGTKNGAINTKIRITRYCSNQIELDRQSETADGSLVINHPWIDFVPPSVNVIHGIWLPKDLLQTHLDVRSVKSWWGKEWTDHLSNTEVDVDGNLLVQRDLGRFLPNTKTLTWYWTSTDLASSVHVATAEKAATTAVGSGNLTISIPSSQNAFGLILTTPSGEPNVGTWPTGDYRVQCDISSIGINILIDFTGSTAPCHAGRVNSALSSEVGTVGTWSPSTNITATGISLRTANWTPTGSTASDRFEITLGIDSGNMMDPENIVFTCDADSFIDGPWVGVTPLSYTLTEANTFADEASGQYRYRASLSENLEV